MKTDDNLFRECDVTDRAVYDSIYLKSESEAERKEGAKALVMPLSFGSVYVVRVSGGESLRALLVSDLNTLAVEECSTLPFGSCIDFVCTPLKEGEYLIIDSDAEKIRIFEYPVLLFRDTDEEWFYHSESGDLNGGEGSWGNFMWSASELLDNVYEPMRAKHPDYISREHIGYDESGKYDMWAYKFEPEDYEQTLFITAGLHGNEYDGFLSLARFLEVMCEGKNENSGLKYLRERVRLIVVVLVTEQQIYSVVVCEGLLVREQLLQVVSDRTAV